MLERWRRERAFRRLLSSGDERLRRYAKTPWPVGEAALGDVAFLALDFELDGLEKGAALLQAGWVAFEGRSIALAEAQSRYIAASMPLNRAAVTIHGIGDGAARGGEREADVLCDLVDALAGRVLLAHAADIELRALSEAMRRTYGVALPVQAICTLRLERKLTPHAGGAEPYRLANCRRRYGLPGYRAHDALSDALATAELFLAQRTRLPDDATLGRHAIVSY